MNKAAINLLIDIMAGALLTALVASGYILWIVLPPGTNRTHGLLGWLRHEWGSLHAWIALFLLSILAVHVALHWRWLTIAICKRLGLGGFVERRAALAGVQMLAIAGAPLGLAVIAAHALVRPLSAPLHGEPLDPRTAGAMPDAMDPQPKRGAVELERAVAALLLDRCSACHDTEEAAAGIIADTPARLLIDQHGTRWILPDDVEGSPLFRVLHVADGESGRGARHELPSAEIAAIRDWAHSLAAPAVDPARTKGRAR